VDSNNPKDTVVGENAASGTSQPKGSTITLSISKGPKTSAVPDVASTDRATAIATLKASGFKAHVQRVDTSDPTQDGIVLSQNPRGGTQAKPGATITIAVGHYSAPPPPTTQPTPTVPTPPPPP